MAESVSTNDRALSDMDAGAKYGYSAGWGAAQEIVYAALNANRDDRRIEALLWDLWKSMGPDARNAGRDAYLASVKSPAE